LREDSLQYLSVISTASDSLLHLWFDADKQMLQALSDLDAVVVWCHRQKNCQFHRFNGWLYETISDGLCV